LLNDSKKLSASQRNRLRPIIEEKAVAWAVGIASVAEIDALNILNASFLAMHRAIAQLDQQPEFLLIDGNRFKPYDKIEHSCEIKGDGRFKNIAAASILAKTHRDEFMRSIHNEHPHYQWDKNHGYPTRAHREAILEFGPCPHHRGSFQLLSKQTKLKLS
jgi:ribonuclease HII